ncbi:MAG: hypothetical protein O7G84_07000, partial [Gammaproteobacteria bacterium]|nr:hypothetical protein [Gammaproteobacteria bacterium]
GMCKGQGTTDLSISGNSPRAFSAVVRESRGISPENGPYEIGMLLGVDGVGNPLIDDEHHEDRFSMRTGDRR